MHLNIASLVTIVVLLLRSCGSSSTPTVAPATAPEQPTAVAPATPQGYKVMLNVGSDGTLQNDGTWKNVTQVEATTDQGQLYMQLTIDAQHNVIMNVDSDLSGEGPDLFRTATLTEGELLQITSPYGANLGTLVLRQGTVFWYPPTIPLPSQPQQFIGEQSA